jgi:hypothetical protein
VRIGDEYSWEKELHRTQLLWGKGIELYFNGRDHRFQAVVCVKKLQEKKEKK